ncbi:aspartate/glutamate racemase family protein [Neptunomonas marina]|uniref:Aspartate/glutamate racemase family protein n=1 Tax=Neptunomonas marina TaxID=1815562 RepID=A0A437QDU3_9GAMM|nr:aspartate/glutamate racemase family protein [Neptunomonas marina]RVU32589.1 aspartate/glutamate racemase family protein [Neptunomonas marina]
MKTIGLLGGMSWESTVTYYTQINQGIKNALGGLHSAKIAMVSVDFAEIEALQHKGDWAATADILSQAAEQLEAAGADLILICTNTMHKVAPAVQEATQIPLLHIADATAQQLKATGVQKVGLLGTRFTMEQSFYRGRLEEQHGISVITPDSDSRSEVHRIIYEELCQGEIKPASKDYYCRVVEDLKRAGAEAVILGCTEIGLLINAADVTLPVFDTTLIHADAAVSVALSTR